MANKTVYPFGTGGQLPSSIGVINDLKTGGADKALSAEMGKVLKHNFGILLDALGEYAFPNGRPTFTWDSLKWSISNNLTHVVNDNSLIVIEDNEEYVAHLSPDDLYAIDESSVVVTMGGVDITSSAYNSGVVTISSVTGHVVISASATTYAQDGLVFQLDGINKGTTSGMWTDLIGNVAWTNYGATSLDNCWQFSGTSYLSSLDMSEYDVKDCSVEVCIESSLTSTNYIVFSDGSKMTFSYVSRFKGSDLWSARGYSGPGINNGSITMGSTSDTGNGKRIVSINGTSGSSGGMVNGILRQSVSVHYGSGTKAIIGGRWNNNALDIPFTGKVYAIRIYNRHLTNDEMLKNQQIDNIRFNLGLTL